MPFDAPPQLRPSVPPEPGLLYHLAVGVGGSFLLFLAYLAVSFLIFTLLAWVF